MFVISCKDHRPAPDVDCLLRKKLYRDYIYIHLLCKVKMEKVELGAQLCFCGGQIVCFRPCCARRVVKLATSHEEGNNNCPAMCVLSNTHSTDCLSNQN